MGTVELGQPLFLLSRLGTQVSWGWQVAKEGWAISKEGDMMGFRDELPPFAKPVWQEKE